MPPDLYRGHFRIESLGHLSFEGRSNRIKRGCVSLTHKSPAHEEVKGFFDKILETQPLVSGQISCFLEWLPLVSSVRPTIGG